ncbi:MAG: hypothetical protein KAU03_03040 [Candidatus Altiarchaeales archaeon]|nr:hypothetical protein [Candidatus Altiarchaeales archaeon]
MKKYMIALTLGAVIMLFAACVSNETTTSGPEDQSTVTEPGGQTSSKDTSNTPWTVAKAKFTGSNGVKCFVPVQEPMKEDTDTLTIVCMNAIGAPIILNSITISGDCTKETVEPAEGSMISGGDTITLTCAPNTVKKMGDSFTVDMEIAYTVPMTEQERKLSGSFTGTVEEKSE